MKEEIELSEQKRAEIYYMSILLQKAYMIDRSFKLFMHESPDFILENDKKHKIGIELTEYSNFTNLKKNNKRYQKDSKINLFQEKFDEKLFNKAKDKIYSLKINFSSKFYKLNKNDVDSLKEDFSNFIVKELGNEEFSVGNFRDIIYYDIGYNDIPRVNVTYSYEMWRVSSNDDLKESITNSIKNKNNKIKNYTKCDEYWLLLHPPINSVTLFDPNFNILRKKFSIFLDDKVRFTKIYFITKYDKSVEEIEVVTHSTETD